MKATCLLFVLQVEVVQLLLIVVQLTFPLIIHTIQLSFALYLLLIQ